MLTESLRALVVGNRVCFEGEVIGGTADNPKSWSTGEATPDAGGLTSCSVRPWLIPSRDVNWASRHAGICLMADVLTSSGGRLIDEPGATLTAQFDRTERAVNAARRLQRAMHSFAQHPDTAGFAASIVIHKPEDWARRGPASAVEDLLWSTFAAPGQILLSGSAHEILQLVPGFRFRPVPPENSGSSVACQELLWTDSGTLDAWRAQVTAAAQIAQPLDHAGDLDVRAPEVKTPAEDFPLRAAERYHDEPEPPLPRSRGLGRQERLWIAGGVAFVAVVAILGFLLRAKSNQTGVAPQGPKVQVDVQPPTPAQKAPEASKPSQEKPPRTQNTPAQRAADLPKPPVRTQTGSVSQEPASPPPVPHKAVREPETGVEEYEGFSSKQIPQLLRRADEDAGAGNYDRAQQEYEIVLKLQPGNGAAKEGLYKLGLKMNER